MKTSRCRYARSFRVELTPIVDDDKAPTRAFGRIVFLHGDRERVVPFDVKVDPTPAECG